MWGRREAIIILGIVMLLGSTLALSDVRADTFHRDSPGPVGGTSDIILTSEAHVRVVSSGTTNYSVYFMTDDNFQNMINNLSYAYIQELSATNVTSVDLQADLPAGSYGIWYVLSAAGTISDNGVHNGMIITYPSNGGYSIPWDTVAIVALTALVSVLATYAVMKHRAGKR
jgi:hypothetical protein